MADPDKIAISIHALREEGDRKWSLNWISGISIHALREEGDPGHESSGIQAAAISIHALREEGDLPA